MNALRIAFSLTCLAGCCAALLVSSGGCASYATPGRGADMSTFGSANTLEADRAQQTGYDVKRELEKQPLAKFPSAIAVARVQAPGYQGGYGGGRYCVVSSRDVEKEEHFQRLAKLPEVLGIAPVSRLLLPSNLQSDEELRRAAAAVRADLLLVYTIDTYFTVDEKAKPLSVISLGLSPTRLARVNTTAAAVLMDTRNGYVYGVCESSDQQTQLSAAWTDESAVDDARRRAEAKVFEKLVGEFETTWKRVLAEQAPPAGVTG